MKFSFFKYTLALICFGGLLYSSFHFFSDFIEKKVMTPSDQNFKNCPEIANEGFEVREQGLGIESFRYYERLKREARGTLIFFHGSGRSACENREILPNLNELPLNVMILEYPGYGQDPRKVTPSETIILRNALAFVKKVKLEMPQNWPLIVYGASMGTTITTYIASKTSVSGVILRNAATSIIETGKNLYPSYVHFLIDILLKSQYRADLWAKNVKAPTLLLHAEKDKWVPLALGKKQFKNFVKTKNHRFVVIEKAHHMNTFSFPKYRDHFHTFVKKILSPPK